MPTQIGPIAMPARALIWTPSTGGRASRISLAFQGAGGRRAHGRSHLVRSGGPDREDRVTGEAHDVAAMGVDPLDDAAE